MGVGGYTTCILPQYPKDGTYTVANVDDAAPGQSFGSSVLLTVSCRRGFGLVAANGKDAAGKHVYCINGKWLQDMPKCVRFCKLNPDPSIRYMCHVPGASYKLCSTLVSPSTVVKPICNKLYRAIEDLPYMTCVAGYWDNWPQCKADCGLITPEGEQLVIGGELAARGELPWHCGIYLKTTEPYMQICSGSLISNDVVLSAAHCFWDDVYKQLPASDYAVAIGKLYRPWNSDRDIGSQTSDVKEIKLPILFHGQASNFQEDIAVVLLETPFVYKTYIRPVCLNFDTNFDNYQLQQGKSGKVAGWGLTEVNGRPSPVLKVVSLPYVKHDTCIDILPPSFTEYITSDKFCAGYTNGTSLCKGDSGGGLAFADKEQGRYRYYLRGVVSTAPKHDVNTCNEATLTTFTKLKKHEDFIRSSLAESAKKTCPWYLFQCANGDCVDQGANCNGIRDCADGSDESAELCTPDTETELLDRVCVFPEAPAYSWYYITNATTTPDVGQVLKSFSLVVNCHRYYRLLTPAGYIKYDNLRVVCVDGKWSSKMPQCIEHCYTDYDLNVRYKCRHPVTDAPMVCHKYKKPGLSSRFGGVDYIRPDPNIKCPSNTTKDELVPCKEDCGRVLTLPSDEVEDVNATKREYMPWHVSIYEKSGKDYLYYCGGTIITNNVVISAADRFWDEEKGYIRLSEWAAAAGQTYRLWDYDKNTRAQKTEVKGITVPENYEGRNDEYKLDVALLVLVKPFVFDSFVKHVCLDWHTELDTRQLEADNEGKLAGWGRNSIDSPLTRRAVQLYNKPTWMCREHLRWFQEDQICANYTNNETHQFLSSNVGSGLVFPHNVSGVERYYLRGVLTTMCLRDELCYMEPDHLYATFAKISAFKQFIQQFVNYSR